MNTETNKMKDPVVGGRCSFLTSALVSQRNKKVIK